MQYRIVSPTKKDFETTHQPGELVDFSPAEAEELLKSGAIEAAHVPFAPGNLKLNANIGDHHG